MKRVAALVLAGLAASIAGAEVTAPPVLAKDGSELFPEGAGLPKGEASWEREWLARRAPELLAARGAVPSTPPPTGPIECVAEYEPMDGLIIAWEPSSSGQTTILTQIALNVTTLANAKIYVSVDSVSEQNSVTTTLTNAGVNMSRVQFVVTTTDSIWMRDYGPRYIYEGGVRAIVDHEYNRPQRPNDDNFPLTFGPLKRHNVYRIPLIHGGGNFHLDASDLGYATELIVNENPQLGGNAAAIAAEVERLWADYQGLDVTLTDPFPTNIDSTQHIDMWILPVADNKIMISDWPNASGSTQDQICDATATLLTNRGYTVYRIPAVSSGGTHYTYANAVICNNVVIVPQYTNSGTGNATRNAEALAQYQAALPTHTIVPLDCQAIVTLAGVIHCIVMHVPANKNGANPTMYLRTQNDSPTYNTGDNVEIRWSSDDDNTVSNVDLLLSLDGGNTWPETIASATADDGSFLWTVPATGSAQAMLKVVGRDAQGNLGEDLSNATFTIVAPANGDSWSIR